MKLKISTPVNASVQKVKEGFNIDLFKALAPPFPRLNVKRFDGSKKDDLVELELDFFTHKQTWVSLITYDHTDDKIFEFIDIGKELPFPFKKWRHHHIVQKNSYGSDIIDDIEYSSGSRILDILLYPLMYLQFAYRKPVYRKLFADN